MLPSFYPQVSSQPCSLFSCGKLWLLVGGQEQPEKCLFAGARVPIQSPAQGRTDLSNTVDKIGGEVVCVCMGCDGMGEAAEMPVGSCSLERQIWCQRKEQGEKMPRLLGRWW